jgi:ligand-binding SRPBCC domain-containing protein
VAIFVKSVVIEAPVEAVFAFHRRPDALQLLTPPFPPVRILERSAGIAKGSRVVLSVAGMRWVALHTACEEDAYFVDEQREGPFEKWIHRHEFEDIGIGTRLTDRVGYILRGGPIVNTLFAWLLKPVLYQMFSYRHRVTKRICEADVPVHPDSQEA